MLRTHTPPQGQVTGRLCLPDNFETDLCQGWLSQTTLKRTYSRGWLCLPDDIETDLYQGWLCLPDDLESDLRKGWLSLPDDLETDLFEGWLCLPDDFETDLCQGWLCLPDDLETDLRKGWLSLPDDLDKTIRNIMEQALRKQNMHAQPEHCTTRTSSSTAWMQSASSSQALVRRSYGLVAVFPLVKPRSCLNVKFRCSMISTLRSNFPTKPARGHTMEWGVHT